jgi:hypothetical protein
MVDIGYYHKCILPRAISRHDSSHVALKLSPQINLWHHASVTTEENVANSHMVVAIGQFVATIGILWQ